jgi:hypothetical protein
MVINVQETMRGGDWQETVTVFEQAWTFINHGKGFGSSSKDAEWVGPGLGVGMLLSPEAVLRWDGNVLHHGPRMLSVLIDMGTRQWQPVSYYGAHSYQPEELQAFHNEMEALVMKALPSTVVTLAGDLNAKLGHNSRKDRLNGNISPARGNHGDRSTRLDVAGHGSNTLRLIENLGLITLVSCFKKKKVGAGYATWRSEGRKTKRTQTLAWYYCGGHQLDHILVRQMDRKLVIGCKVVPDLGSSDHDAVEVTFDFDFSPHRVTVNTTKSKKRRNKKRAENRKRVAAKAKLTVNRTKLQDIDTRKRYIDAFKRALSLDRTSTTAYERLVHACNAAAAVLREDTAPTKSWYERSKASLDACRHEKDTASKEYRMLRNGSSDDFNSRRSRLLNARRAYKKAQRIAIDEWAVEQTKGVTDNTHYRANAIGRKLAQEIELERPRPKMPRMRDQNGVVADSDEQSNKNLKDFWEKTLNYDSQIDPAMLEKLQSVVDTMGITTDSTIGEMPNRHTIKSAVDHLHDGKATGKDSIGAEEFKAVIECKEGMLEVEGMVAGVWKEHGNDANPDWVKDRLALIFKGGDKHDPGKWRAICLLQIAVKIVATIVNWRLIDHLSKKIGPHSFCGFLPKRGTTDGIHVVNQVIQTRLEWDLDTYITFIDFIKCFDRLNRKMMWEVLKIFGIPEVLIVLIQRMMDGSTLSFKVENGDIIEMKCGTGAKQGLTLSPTLFLYVFKALLLTMEWPTECNFPTFRTPIVPDGVLPCDRNVEMQRNQVFQPNLFNSVTGLLGRGVDLPNQQEEFEVPTSEYADDAAIMTCDEESARLALPAFQQHAAKWGCQVHYAAEGTPAAKSKTVAMRCSRPGKGKFQPQTPISLKQFEVGSEQYPSGTVPWVDCFKYLGSFIVGIGSELGVVDNRIRQAQKAWWNNRKLLCRRSSARAARGAMYTSLVLSQMFYSTEFLSLSAESERRLDVFINRCVRRMAGTNLMSMRKRVIGERTQKDLNDSFKIEGAHTHVTRRLMNWLRKVACMKDDRVPKKMLFAYPRPADCHDHIGKRTGQWIADRGIFQKIGVRMSFSRHARSRIIQIVQAFCSEFKRTGAKSALAKVRKAGWTLKADGSPMSAQARRMYMQGTANIRTTDDDNWACYVKWMDLAKEELWWKEGIEIILNHEKAQLEDIRRRKRARRVVAQEAFCDPNSEWRKENEEPNLQTPGAVFRAAAGGKDSAAGLRVLAPAFKMPKVKARMALMNTTFTDVRARLFTARESRRTKGLPPLNSGM